MDLKTQVIEVLVSEIVPALEMDGTQLEVLDVSSGVVRLRLGGVCSGCPSTLMAVIHGLEHEFRKRLPQIDYIEAVP